MGKRFQDIPYHTFSFWSDMTVVCPRCGKAGTVCLDQERKVACFQCESCYEKREIVPGDHTTEITAQCTATGRYFRQAVAKDKVRGQKVRVQCPYCEETVLGEVSDTGKRPVVVLETVREAEDPYFHYPLYFQGRYRGKSVWALNRSHLQYLLDYLSADLRTVPPDFHETYQTMRSQSDRLPAFMKTAKNRAGIVKLLTKLQGK